MGTRRRRNRLSMASVLGVVLVAAPALATGGVTVVAVDCDKGDRIAKALEKAGTELVIEIRGVCDENVVIRRERVTLRGSDPAVDGIRGVGPGVLLQDAVVRVEGTRVVRLENLAITGGAARGLVARGTSGVEVVNCRVEGHGRDGIQFVEGSFIDVSDTVISGVGRIALSGFGGDLALCTRCTISDSPFGVAAINGSRISVRNSTVDGDSEGVFSQTGGSFIELVNTAVSGGDFAIDALQTSEIDMRGGSVSGSVLAFDGGRIRMSGVSHASNPSGFNFFAADSFGQLLSATSLLGQVVVDDFSRLLVQGGSSIAGDLVCASGGDAFCDDPSKVSGTSSCGQCPKP